jgi:serine/threonine protein kinase/Tfp pilus assembly protein PilF
MAAISKSARICETCGTPTEATSSGDLGCIVCLLDIGLDRDVVDPGGAFVETPQRLGAYTIEHHVDGSVWELGHGAMGITYRAIDKALDRPVALKIINTNLGSRSAEARDRFMREARIAAALRHPNVATVHQFGVREETGQFYYAMELVEGETLEERVRRLGPLDVLTTIDVALQVTAALAAAEERGLVHRDLKPGNLMFVSQVSSVVGIPQSREALRRARRARPTNCSVAVKVIDFGVAKAISEKTSAMSLTHGGFVGTPAFASPEQFTNAPVDVRSDIYSLGATLWFLLTGYMLFSGRTVEEIRDARRSKPLPVEQLKAARVPHRFITLLRSMLAIEPAARPAGARELAAKLQAIRYRITGRGKIVQRFAIAAAVVAVTTIVAVRVFHQTPPKPTAPVIPEKSIAVLPFESFSDDKENAYFADGVQDDVLTDLTKVADLKVISRRSVAQYRDMKQSIRQIGQALQVTHVLEGSVRKVAGRIHVTAQLIDARNETEIWAEKYDRDIADLFQIQSEISQAIVSQLKATLSPAARAAIEEKPTQDNEAYDLYLRAHALVYQQTGTQMGTELQENSRKAIPLLESAISRDPKFALAYCLLAEAQLTLDDPVKAKPAIDTALRISPNSGEAHLIMAKYFIRSLEDVSAGEKELAIAATRLPGRVDVFNLRPEVEEQRGQWKQALHDREKATELDPRDSFAAEYLVTLNIMLRRYEEAERLIAHATAFMPQQSTDFVWRHKAMIAVARGDTKSAMAALDANPLRNLGVYGVNHQIAHVFVLERNYAKAEEILQSVEETARARNMLPKLRHGEVDWARGITLEKLARIARFQGEIEKARGYFESARQVCDQALNAEHNSWVDSHARAYIAEIDAALGRKDDAIREGRKALELWPLKRNAVLAPDVAIYVAIAYMWSGERDAALQQLAGVVKLPASSSPLPVCPNLSAGELKLNPIWDELRNDPRFDKIVAEAAKPIKLD